LLTTAKPNAGSFFGLAKSLSLSKFIRVNEMTRFNPALGLAATVSANAEKTIRKSNTQSNYLDYVT